MRKRRFSRLRISALWPICSMPFRNWKPRSTDSPVQTLTKGGGCRPFSCPVFCLCHLAARSRISASMSSLSHSNGPTNRQALSCDEVSNRLVGNPRIPTSRDSFAFGSKPSRKPVTPSRSRNGTALAAPPRSIETSMTTMPSSASAAAARDSAGSSATQGAHHVAQKLTRTGLPARSAIKSSAPVSSAITLVIGGAASCGGATGALSAITPAAFRVMKSSSANTPVFGCKLNESRL